MLAETNVQKSSSMPDWVPDEAPRYLAHVEAGHSIRSIARQAGCHASTVLRQVRRTEQRREDLLVDLALSRLRDKRMPFTTGTASEGATKAMTIGETVHENSLPDDQEFRTTASRVLRRMNERGASLAIARDMEKVHRTRRDVQRQTYKRGCLREG